MPLQLPTCFSEVVETVVDLRKIIFKIVYIYHLYLLCS